MTPVIVFNLHVRVTIADLFDIFSIFGNLTNIILSHGFALVTYEYYEDAIRAMEEIDGQMLGGYQLNVKLYKPNMLI